MERLEILEKMENLNWDYDEEADVLYINIENHAKQEVANL